MESGTSVRVLVNVLDGLVRSARSQMPATAAIATRGHAIWMARPEAELELAATELSAAGETLLVASPDEGRWLLPAFMAGLRRIRMLDYATPDDLLRLGKELSSLESTLASIGHFRDWLWADGAEGFDVAIDDSFSDDAEAAFLDFEAQKQQLMATRMMAAEALSLEGLKVASRDLDAAAHRQEFAVSLDAYCRQIGEGETEAGESDLQLLREGCNESVAWGDGQVYLALAYPSLQAALPPEVLAKRMAALAHRRADARFLGLLATIIERGDKTSRELLAALHKSNVGTLLALALPANDEVVGALARLLLLDRNDLCGQLFCDLLDRCHSQRDYARIVAAALSASGAETFCRALAEDSLTPDAAFVLVRLLVHFKAPPHCIARLLPTLPPESALRFVVELPTPQLMHNAAAAEKLLITAPTDLAGKALERLLVRGDRPLLEVVGRVFLSTSSQPWNRTMIARILKALSQPGLAMQFLVPLVRNTEEQEDVRIMAINLMDGDPVAQAQAVRRSVRSAFDAPGVKACMRAKRRRLGEDSHG